MKKPIVFFVILSMVVSFTACNLGTNPSNSSEPLSSTEQNTPEQEGTAPPDSANPTEEEQSREPVQLSDLPEDTVLIFQSKNNQLSGRIVDGTIKIPFYEFVEDMGYTYDVDGDVITIHNSDLGVDHVVEIGSNTVTTGAEQKTLQSTLDYLTVDDQEVLFVPTGLYTVFEGK